MASSHKRSFVKALTWRLLSIAVTTGFVLAVTGRVDFAAYMLAFDCTVMTGLYFVHERLWKRTRWGKYEEGNDD
jgi:adenylylsulfate kinase